jgi:hypothetical protein
MVVSKTWTLPTPAPSMSAGILERSWNFESSFLSSAFVNYQTKYAVVMTYHQATFSCKPILCTPPIWPGESFSESGPRDILKLSVFYQNSLRRATNMLPNEIFSYRYQESKSFPGFQLTKVALGSEVSMFC